MREKKGKNIFVFQTGQHLNKRKLVVSGPHLSFHLSYIPVLVQVKQVIPLFCRQNNLFLSLPARKIYKAGLNFCTWRDL